MSIEELRQLVRCGQVKWTAHCMQKMGERDINIGDVKSCIENGEIIEDYPEDFPHPSCLIFGYASNGKVLHTVVGCDGSTAYIITTYIPNTIVFESDLKTRRR